MDERLRQIELRHRFLADSASDVIWTMTPDGRITYISPAIERARGLTPDEAMQQSLDQILTPDSQATVAEYLAEVNAGVKTGRGPQNFRGDLEYYKKDGSTYWTEVLAYPLIGGDGSLVEIVGVTRDIDARKHYEQELERAREEAEAANQALALANAKLQRLATTDDLTGAANRRHFEEALDMERERARRYGEPVSLILFDIDHFKRVNDRFGHQAGDITLVELTHLVSLRLRALDLLARWGGEEFVVMMPHCRTVDAMKLADRLRSMIADYKFPVVGHITVSMGVTALRPDEQLEDGLKRVDDAMYQAKRHGRNRICEIE
ncbi:diguanylate cyclase [Parvibaculum sp.]|uniref:sensor domain-containing diguanylate cyclase n=1 Tax=Parvibaculum sp. TaxID=2024848 RepID=UPI00320FF062